MEDEKRAKLPLHWGGWIWVIGHFVWGGLILIGMISLLANVPLKGWNVMYVIALLSYAALSITSSVVLLINRKKGFMTAIITLSISSVLFLIPLIWLFISPVQIMASPSLMWGVWGTVVNILWWIYFILARRKYGIGREAKEV